jgi:Protein of unknown function (DUF3096)
LGWARELPLANCVKTTAKIPRGVYGSAQSVLGRPEDNRRHDQLLRTKEVVMNITLSLAPLVSLLAGVLILIAPRMLNYIVAIYLIVVGVLGLFGDIRLR